MITIPAQLITIEGSDGAGKETQGKMLHARLSGLGKKVAMVSFPRYRQTAAGWALYEALKGYNAPAYRFEKVDPQAASLLYASDRKQSLPFLCELMGTHDIVILDRYVESNLLHQGGKFSSVEEREAFAEWLFDLEYRSLALPRPDITLYLRLPYDISRRRASERAQKKREPLDRVERDDAYTKNSYEAGLFYAKHFGWTIIPCTDSTGRELSQEEVHDCIFRELSSPLLL